MSMQNFIIIIFVTHLTINYPDLAAIVQLLKWVTLSIFPLAITDIINLLL